MTTPASPAPRTRWWRPRNLVVAFTLLVLLLLGAEVYVALTAVPGAAIDYPRKMHDLAAEGMAPTAETEKAWNDLLWIGDQITEVNRGIMDAASEIPGPQIVAYEAIYLPTDEFRRRGFLGLDDRGDDKADQEAIGALANQSIAALRKRGVYERIATLARTPHLLRPVHSGDPLRVEIPELYALREITKIQLARMHAARLADDEPAFADAFEQALAPGRIAAAQPLVIHRLTAQYTWRQALAGLRRAVAAHRFSPESCLAMLSAMDRQVRRPDLGRVMEQARYAALDAVQWTHTKEGLWGGRRLVANMDELKREYGMKRGSERPVTRLANLGAIAIPRKAQVDAVVNAHFDELRAAAALQGSARRATLRAIHQRVVAKVAADEYYKFVLFTLTSVFEMEELFDAELAGTRLMLAIELFHHGHDRFPAALAELVPEILSELPRCPFAPDGQFIYRCLDVPDQHGRMYILYSTGPDGVDNNGKEPLPRENEIRAPEPREGDDLIINRPPED